MTQNAKMIHFQRFPRRYNAKIQLYGFKPSRRGQNDEARGAARGDCRATPDRRWCSRISSRCVTTCGIITPTSSGSRGVSERGPSNSRGCSWRTSWHRAEQPLQQIRLGRMEQLLMRIRAIRPPDRSRSSVPCSCRASYASIERTRRRCESKEGPE